MDISYERYLRLWHRYPRENVFGRGAAPAPMTRLKWEDYGRDLRAIEINVLEHQNRLMDQTAAVAAKDVPTTQPEVIW